MRRKNIFLGDKDWLLKKYCDEKLSSFKIAKIIECHPNSVINALIRHGINRRFGSDSMLCAAKDDFLILSGKAMDVIIGSILGDATINRRKRNGLVTGTPFFSKGNINLDHIEYVAKQIFKKNYSERIFHRPIREPMTDKNGRTYIRRQIFEIKSFSHAELLPLFNKWYKTERFKDNQKIIPDDLKINATVLLHWFMDDGSAIIHKCHKNTNSSSDNLYISLATNGFYKEDVTKLIRKIYSDLGLKGTLAKSKYGFGYSIVFPENQINKFYNIIGDCPVKSMQYKWKDINSLNKPRLNNKRWEETFIRLKEFIEKNNHYPSISSSNISEIKLGKWISNQKMIHKGVIKTSLFNQYRKEKLESLPNWNW